MSAARPEEQNEADVAIGAEAAEAVFRVVDVEGGDLPGELKTDESEGEEENQVRAGKEGGQRPKHDGDRIEGANPGRAFLAEFQRCRFEAEHQVVFGILMGVDGVIADGPGDGAEVEQDRGQFQPVFVRRPADQSAPVEGEAEDELRPVREALHVRVDQHQQK